jgi:hypothetical protein
MKKDYWESKINKMLTDFEDAYKTEVRTKALWYLIKQKYPEMEDKKSIEIIKDIEYLSRKMRRVTEDKQKKLKRELEKNYIKNLYDR